MVFHVYEQREKKNLHFTSLDMSGKLHVHEKLLTGEGDGVTRKSGAHFGFGCFTITGL